MQSKASLYLSSKNNNLVFAGLGECLGVPLFVQSRVTGMFTRESKPAWRTTGFFVKPLLREKSCTRKVSEPAETEWMRRLE